MATATKNGIVTYTLELSEKEAQELYDTLNVSDKGWAVWNALNNADVYGKKG